MTPEMGFDYSRSIWGIGASIPRPGIEKYRAQSTKNGIRNCGAKKIDGYILHN
jgi:hypothetical protein